MSQWIDIQLQKVLHLCLAYIGDTWQLLHDLRLLKFTPEGFKLFTCNAKSMHANIPTAHGIQIIKLWLQKHFVQLPNNFPITRIIRGLEIVMQCNVFSFGNEYFTTE